MTKFNKFVLAFSFAAVVAVLASGTVYAEDCESNYGGGETCVRNKSFEIRKYVRVEDEDTKWDDKVTDVAEDDVIEFKVTIKNVGEVTVDDMKMEDKLPDELERIGGDGLTEYFNNFKPGDKEEFIIRAKVKKDEFDRDNFEKCVVNKAQARYKGKFEGSDTATVCYGNAEVKELPKTGASVIDLTALGFGLISVGTLIKRTKRA